MAQTLGGNANNDIYIGPDGNLVMLTGQAAVADACQTVSRVRLGEEVLSVNAGLPFFEAVFNGVPNLAVYQNSLLNALLGVEGVESVNNITSTVETVNNKKVLNYTATIENQFGLEFQISGSITP